MTNLSSGSKRPWDGQGESYRKRHREEPRDWRDVYLKSPRHSSVGSWAGRRDGGQSRGAEYDRGESRRSSRRPSNERPSNGTTHPPKDDSEKEEGEISPPVSPKPAVSIPADPSPLPPSEQPELELELEMSSSPPLESTLASRRARRQAILAKYAGTASVDQTQPSDNTKITSNQVSSSSTPMQGVFNLTKNHEEGDAQVKVQAQNESSEQISAADYDPSLDRREDERKRVLAVNNEPIPEEETLEEEMEEEEEEEDVDDMFAVGTAERKVKKVKKVKVVKPVAPALITTTLDSAADPEGYYQVILGEQLDGGRYQVYSSLGKGMFANVVRARVIHGEVGEAGKEVAIKIIRCQESMYRAGLKEVQILNKLKQADPDDRKHIVRLERTFEHRGHLCLVFESMSMNLRDVVKRFGKDVGLNIRAVRVYATQLFVALGLLRKANVMHADIKPDNILVNEQKTVLKVCDLGSASDASENEITPYLVSRFYRAPEIILGVPYDPALDMWSVGCTLFELYTGKILFPGRSNNQMLLLMMELKGRFNSKMIKKAKFGDVYFDEMGGFDSIEKDRVSGSNVVRKVHISKPTRDLRSRLMPPLSVKLKDDENKLLLNFVDLLDKCLALDPSRRISPKEALVHPFIRA